MERRLAAILAADVVGYSRLMGEDEEATLRTLSTYREIIHGLITAHRGRVFGSAGDSVIAEFSSPVEAARCAHEIQLELKSRNADMPEDRRMRFRIGVNLGDVMAEGENLLGDGVNIAARLETLAEPGGICVSGTVYDHLAGKLDLVLDDLGERKLKNIARPVRVWRWAGDDAMQSKYARPSRADKPSIAVLPFTNMSGDSEQDYFADGITEDIITELSRFRSLFVIARNSSFTYKGRSVNVQEVGRDLGVRYLVEGSVRRAGDRVRITAQLIETTTGRHVWADRYDQELRDIFSLQDEITRTIAAAVEPELGNLERERSRTKAPENLDAWDLYQRGLWYMYQETQRGNKEARRHFEQSIDLSPEFAPAHAALAYVLCFDIINGYREISEDLIEEVYWGAKKAISLDERDAMAHVVLGRIQLLRCKHEDAIEELEIAIRLNPNLADAYHGLGFALTMSGRPEESLPQFETAIRLSPYDPRASSFYEMRAWALIVLGRHVEAAESARVAVRKPNADIWAYSTLGAALGHLGHIDEARSALEELLRRKLDFSVGFVRRNVFYVRNPDHLDLYLDGLRKAGLSE